jgi:hypothetical protein
MGVRRRLRCFGGKDQVVIVPHSMWKELGANVAMVGAMLPVVEVGPGYMDVVALGLHYGVRTGLH